MPYEITPEELERAQRQKEANGDRGADGYTDAELFRHLDELTADLGEFPRPSDVADRGEYSVTTFYNHFGRSWRDVKAAYDKWARSQ